jgi:hypothetical protein
MTPMQQMFLGLGAADKTYLDSVFSTRLYEGNNSTQTITNGLDLASDGGMIWIKNRDSAKDHCIVDTARGIGKRIETNNSNAEDSYVTSKNISSFTSTGFTLGVDEGHDEFNKNGTDYSSWNFKKQKGFFTMVQWTGNGADDRAISHDLGCIPGMIIAKPLSDAGTWTVYHRGSGATKYLALNDTQAESTDEFWADTTPTASNFYVQGSKTNANNTTFIAYLFAGGESTAATAKSVEFHGGDDSLVIYNQADLSPEGGDFTCEMWIKPDSWSSGDSLVYASSSGFSIKRDGSNNTLIIGMAGSTTHLTSTRLPDTGVWTHVAVARSSGTMRLFFNGILNKEATVTHTYASPVTMYIVGGGGEFNGKISNYRFVKGTAVYTSSFRPPTEPLTNITNTKLLCCNSSSVTGSTVTPGTVTSGGPPDASTDSPFDDTAAYKFGEGGDQNIIKTASHAHATTDPVRIYTGWEPQWIMCKNATQSSNWAMYDVMRGIYVSSDGPSLAADSDAAENGVVGQGNIVIPHGDGFTLKYGLTAVNPGNGNTIVYMAIRRSDGATAPTPEAGTDVFAMDMGVGSSSDPAFLSGFPVDFAIYTEPAGGSAKSVGTRLLGPKKLASSSTDAEANDTKAKWENSGGYGINRNSDFIAWMWKRGQGMDLVDYEGDGVNGRSISHSLNSVPQMMIAKRRSNTEDWSVYHIGLNGGTNPYTKVMTLNSTATEVDMTGTTEKVFKSTPTSTHFEIGSHDRVNTDGEDYHVLLFSSISGISKVGYYTGNGSSGLSVTVGFQPRFILFRGTNMGGPWRVLDSLRGMSSGNDKSLSLNSTGAEVTNFDWLDVTSTGWTINTTDGEANASGKNYIYYAHA